MERRDRSSPNVFASHDEPPGRVCGLRQVLVQWYGQQKASRKEVSTLRRGVARVRPMVARGTRLRGAWSLLHRTLVRAWNRIRGRTPDGYLFPSTYDEVIDDP